MKIVSAKQIKDIAHHLKADSKIVIFTNGCFDILHVGHVRYLAAAKQLGDCLIVGLNSDHSVQRLKGPTRPINNEADRAEVLSALAAVDYVVVFDEHTAENLVTDIQPNIYVKGGDYHLDELPEAKVAAVYGGRTILMPEVPGKSSSHIIKKMQK